MMDEEQKIPPAPVIPKPPIPPQPKIVRDKQILYLDNGIQFQPPNAADLEKVVLAAFLIDERAKEVIDLLEPEIFYDTKHQHIFRAVQTLHSKSYSIDLLTVTEELQRIGKIDIIGGAYYLVQLTNKIGSAAHIEYHIRILCQKYVLRELISMSRETLFKGLHNDPDVFDLIDRIENNIARVTNVAIRNLNIGVTNATEELRNKIKLNREGSVIGYPSGMEEYDKWCGGFQRRWLAILGARPGMGKTSAILAIIYHMAFEKGIKVVFFSLEMSAIDLKYRIAARMTRIPFEKINMGDLTDEQFDHVDDALNQIEANGIKIIDDITNIHKIATETRKLKSEGYEVFFLDYLQLVEISGNSGDMTGEMVMITRTLKSLKNELNIPFIALSQIDRIADKREGHRPQLSDLKQSSSIEQDADVVIFLLRQAYYNKSKNKIPVPPNQPNPDYIAEWIVAKGRSIGTKDFDVYLDLSNFILKSGPTVPF